MGVKLTPPSAIFGNVLLRRFYTIFDIEKKAIGVALANRGSGVSPNLTPITAPNGAVGGVARSVDWTVMVGLVIVSVVGSWVAV